MHSIDIVLLFCVFISLALVLKLVSQKTPSKLRRRPPGPLRLPVIGNILSVGMMPHRMMPHQSIERLKGKYGPVVWLQLGLAKTLVIQSAKTAEELYKKHDRAFSGRFVPDSLTAYGYYKGTLLLGQYGEYWRVMRKLSCSGLFSHQKVRASAPIRQTCIDIMIQWIKEDSDVLRVNGGTGEIQLESYLMIMLFNLLGNLTMSRNIMSSKSEKGCEFYEAMTQLMEWSGTPNLVDPFPFLRFVDPQRIRSNTVKHGRKLVNVIKGFVEERIREKELEKVKGRENDFLDALLEYGRKEGADELPMKNVTILILEMFIAGTETTATTLHWAMAELMRNPESLRKLKEEIDQFIITSSRMVEENDIANLPYLQAVVKETMRLHPPVALIPRKAMEDTQYMGYFVPRNTIVLVNTWAIHRDPETWEDPLSFKPERFLDMNSDSRGQNFEFIPFGFGRRTCVGMFLADKMVGLTLAKLIQTFDWNLPANTCPHTLDMRERNGLAIRKRLPLIVIPTPSDRKM